MAVHSDAVAAILGEKQDIYRARHVERPDVHSLCIDLWFDDAEVIFARALGNMNAACSQLPTRNRLVLFNLSVRCGRSLQLGHGGLHARSCVSSWWHHYI